MHRAKDALVEVSKSGAFVRTGAEFRTWIGDKHPAASKRYWLFVSAACPWASRCLAVRQLKGLEECISVAVTHPTWERTKPGDPNDTHCGWSFKHPNDAPIANPAGFGLFPSTGCSLPPKPFKNIRQVYEEDPSGKGVTKFTVPVLWDAQLECIVNNESSEIIRMLNSDFNEFASNPSLDLYPEHLRESIDAVNEWIYDDINDGVYKCGFARSQEAHDAASANLYAALDRAESILQKQRYLVGSQITEADIRLFVTLVRFDPVYVVYFKCNQKRIADYQALGAYTRDLYQTPGVAQSVFLDHIVHHYYSSHPVLNAYAVVPYGSHPDRVKAALLQPHGRDEKKA